MILFVWHNPYQPLLEYAFLPWIGLLLIIIVVVYCWTKYKLTPGDKKIWIPLAVIAASIVLSGVFKLIRAEANLQETMGIASIGAMLFLVYLVARLLSKDIFAPFSIAVPIEAISIVVYGATHNWSRNGGLLSPTNYDIATGLLIFGMLVTRERWRKWIAPFAIVGVLFSGAAEGLFVLCVLGLVYVMRHWKQRHSYEVPAIVGIGVFVVACVVSPEILSRIWGLSFFERVNAATQAITDNGQREQLLYFATGYRAFGNWNLTIPIQPFGYGYNMTRFYIGIPHNIVLIIVEQVGIVAAICWLWIAAKGMKYETYVWVGIVALGVFDHFIWTQAAPWFWCLAGTANWNGEKRNVLNI